jgi:YD repeat-containing protein
MSQRGRTEVEYHYSKEGKLDSTTSKSGGSVYVVYEGNKEYWRLRENDQLLTYQEFDQDGHIVQIRNHRGLAEDGSEWREINYEWKNGQPAKTYTQTFKKAGSKPGVENTFERDKNGLLQNVVYYDFDRNKRKFLVKGFGGPIKYKTSKNGQGQTVVTRTYEGQPVAYTFDERGNWVSIVGANVEEHRVLFYK